MEHKQSMTVTQLLNQQALISDAKGEGVTRLPYSEAWKRTQKTLMKLFESVFDSVSVDEFGNIIADIRGSKNLEQYFAVGSHFDSVVNGGKYDGMFGVIGGFLAIQNYLGLYGRPEVGLRLIAIAEEEGVHFNGSFLGSKAYLGLLENEDVKSIVDSKGKSLFEYHQELGYAYNQASVCRNDLLGFIEMHIEQGPKLEKASTDIGAVSAIVGIVQAEVTLKGFANHSGTTAMGDRQDPMIAYLYFATALLEEVASFEDMVVTFGSIDTYPGNSNVIPESLRFTLDCRSPNAHDLEAIQKRIHELLKIHTLRAKVSIEKMDAFYDVPVSLNEALVGTIEEACKHLDLSYMRMYSGAGHDSQIMALRLPTAMIFVPSVRGVSHNPDELTHEDHLQKGVHVLMETLRRLMKSHEML